MRALQVSHRQRPRPYCQLLPCFDGELISGLPMTNSKSFTVAATKNAEKDRIYVSVGIAGLLHVQA